MTPALKRRLEAALGAAVDELAPLAVGFGLEGAAVTLADRRRLAVKAAAPGSARAGNLALEAFMLGELARLSDLPVPLVHYADDDLLVMDFIETDGGGISESVERHAGELIASLHAVPRPRFGYARDTLIGPLAQPNPESARWVPFFRDHRLLSMARAAHAEAALPSPLLARIERLAQRIEDHLSEPAHPSLLHGDLWTGNVLTRGGKVAGLVDPAIYFGHPEIELAFGTLFGTFGQPFFEAYASRLKLAPGFHAERRDIYNLYPRLVHVRLFGSSYLAGIEASLTRLGC
ncbi:MAG TPA: fructosamine kinase family protein [Methyloceanibacter sp.]|nr:fructosamine kinase family protein [Methyloceanibacter sp.]